VTSTQDVWPAGATAILDVTLIQNNAGGGKLAVDVSPGTGNEMEVLYGIVNVTTGTHGIFIGWNSSSTGSNLTNWSTVASVATPNITFPRYGSITGATETSGAVGWPLRPIISGTHALTMQASGTGAQNDVVRFTLIVRVKGAVPTAISTNSGGTVAVNAGSLTMTTV
jgi:hypothetical protein